MKVKEYINSLDLGYDQKKLLSQMFTDQAELSDALKQVVEGAVKALKDIEREANNDRQVNKDKYNQMYQEQRRNRLEEGVKSSGYKIPLTKEQADLIDIVLGQMSDGYWENNRGYEAIWKNADLDGTTLYIKNVGSRHGFPQMTEAEVIPFFAKKARLVFNAEMRDNGYTWRDKSFLEKPSDYLSRSGDQTMGQIDKLINSMKG